MDKFSLSQLGLEYLKSGHIYLLLKIFYFMKFLFIVFTVDIELITKNFWNDLIKIIWIY